MELAARQGHVTTNIDQRHTTANIDQRQMVDVSVPPARGHSHAAASSWRTAGGSSGHHGHCGTDSSASSCARGSSNDPRCGSALQHWEPPGSLEPAPRRPIRGKQPVPRLTPVLDQEWPGRAAWRTHQACPWRPCCRHRRTQEPLLLLLEPPRLIEIKGPSPGSAAAATSSGGPTPTDSWKIPRSKKSSLERHLAAKSNAPEAN